jgi:hypothetical protein
MNRELQGHYITTSTVGEKTQAFIPAPLPPAPPIEWSSELEQIGIVKEWVEAVRIKG